MFEFEDRDDEYQKDGGENAEQDDKCCLCFPTGCGLKTLAVLQIIEALFYCFGMVTVLFLTSAAGSSAL